MFLKRFLDLALSASHLSRSRTPLSAKLRHESTLRATGDENNDVAAHHGFCYAGNFVLLQTFVLFVKFAAFGGLRAGQEQ